MAGPQTYCPDDELLLAFAEGRLPAADRQTVVEHLDGCAECQAMVGAAAPPGEVEDLGLGALVGRYIIEAKIGSGAMGVVYRARDPELGRSVAVKLIRPAWSRRGSARARLGREARALAQLSNTNVLAVYDFGETKSGSLYIATELVVGSTLEHWSPGHSKQEVVQMFLQAARGLAVAHRQSLVHRDFKPANVLIGADGRARVADFGLVTLASDGHSTGDDEAGDDDVPLGLTAAGAIVGTPRYMAPEQLRGELALAASDQFAFCVSLYEVLYGHAPFAGNSAEALLGAIASGPRKPRRSHPGRQWFSALEIGMSPDPSDRHPDMETLIASLSSPRRQRTTLRLGIAVASVAGISAAALTDEHQAACPGMSEIDADVSRIDALGEAIGKTHPPALTLSTEKVLDEFVRDWRESFGAACARANASQPEADEMLSCLGSRRFELGTALELLESKERPAHAVHTIVHELTRPAECLAPRQGTLVAPSTSLMSVRTRLVDSLLIQAVLLRSAGDTAETERRLLLAEELVVDTLQPSLRARARLLRGNLDVAKGQRESGIAALEETYSTALEASLDSLAHQASVELMRVFTSEIEDAESAARWEERARSLSSETSVVERMSFLRETARSRLHQQELKLAAEAAEHALRIGRAEPGTPTPMLASLEGMLAGIRLQLGDYDAAAEHYEFITAYYRETFGEGHPNIATGVYGLAQLAVLAGDQSEAEGLLDEALARMTEVVGPDHWRVGMILVTRARLSTDAGDFGRALREHRQAVDILEADGGPSNRRLRAALRGEGLTLERVGDHTAALKTRERVLVLAEGADGPESYEVALSLNNVGTSKLALGKYASAEADFRRSIALFEELQGSDNEMLVYPLTGLGEVLVALGQPDQAAPHLERALELSKPDTEERAMAGAALAMALWAIDADQFSERALTLARDAEDRLSKAPAYVAEHHAIERWIESL